jgi:hypothetical protein
MNPELPDSLAVDWTMAVVLAPCCWSYHQVLVPVMEEVLARATAEVLDRATAGVLDLSHPAPSMMGHRDPTFLALQLALIKVEDLG